MAEISEDQIEELGLLADKADNLWSATQLPGLPDRLHKTQLAAGMIDIRDELRALVIKLGDGRNPWAE